MGPHFVNLPDIVCCGEQMDVWCKASGVGSCIIIATSRHEKVLAVPVVLLRIIRRFIVRTCRRVGGFANYAAAACAITST